MDKVAHFAENPTVPYREGMRRTAPPASVTVAMSVLTAVLIAVVQHVHHQSVHMADGAFVVRLAGALMYACCAWAITRLRPSNPTGFFMALAGLSIALEEASRLSMVAHYPLAVSFQRCSLPFFCYLILAHPTGRLTSPLTRGTAVAVALWVWGGELIHAWLIAPHRPDLLAAWTTFHHSGDLVLTIWLFIAVRYALYRMTPVTRRQYIPVATAFAISGISAIVVAGARARHDVLFEAATLMYSVGLLLIPVLFLAGALGWGFGLRDQSVLVSGLDDVASMDTLQHHLRKVLGNPTLVVSESGGISSTPTHDSLGHVSVTVPAVAEPRSSDVVLTFARSPVDWVSPTLENTLLTVATRHYALLKATGGAGRALAQTVQARARRHLIAVNHRVQVLEQRRRADGEVTAEELAGVRRDLERCVREIRRLSQSQVPLKYGPHP